MTHHLYLLGGYVNAPIQDTNVWYLVRLLFKWQRIYGGEIIYNEIANRMEYHRPIKQQGQPRNEVWFIQ